MGDEDSYNPELSAAGFRAIRGKLGYDETDASKDPIPTVPNKVRERELELLAKKARRAIAGYVGAVSGLTAKQRRFLRPVIVEFCGTPRSGKTSCIETVEHFFRRLKCKTKAPLEGAQLAPDYLKDDLAAFNTYTLCYAITTLLQECLNIDKSMLVLLDRGPYDSFAWMNFLVQTDQLDAADRDTLKDFASLSKWSSYVDQVFVMTCTTEEALNREQDSKLIKKDGIAVGPDTLPMLLQQYKDLPEEIHKQAGGKGPQAISVDTSSEKNQQVIAYGVTKHIIRAFESRSNAILEIQ